MWYYMILIRTYRAFPNATYQGSTVSHIGQLFFDTSFSDEVEALAPYSTNTNPGTTKNANDGIFRKYNEHSLSYHPRLLPPPPTPTNSLSPVQEAALGDPVIEYSLFGSALSSDLFGCIAFGIDPSRNGSIQAAAALTENDGVPLAGGGGEGGGGPGGPGGFPPNGSFPGGPTGPGGPRLTRTSSSVTSVASVF